MQTSTTRLLSVQRKTTLGVLAAVIGLSAWGVWAIMRTVPTASDSLSEGDPTNGRIFTELFSAVYRPDDGVGDIAIGAVYYFPLLSDSLAKFTQKSEHQAEVARALFTEGANDRTIAIYAIVDSRVPQVGQSIPTAELRDDEGTTYSIKKIEPIDALLPQDVGQVRTASILFFDAVGSNKQRFNFQEHKMLTLTINNIGGVPTRTFEWNLRVLPVQ